MSVVGADDGLRRREADRAGAAGRAANIESIQVDWPLYGPKLAQVALTVGADDVDGVAAVDPGVLGTRRSPIEEIQRQHPRGGARSRSSGTARFRVARPDGASIRLGAVDYLNARPLVYGLELRTDLFALRFDVAVEVRRAAARGRDRRRHDSVDRVSARRRAVPHRRRHGHHVRRAGGVGGAVQRRSRSSEIRSIAVDTSSRTSNALLRVLCRERSASSRSSCRCRRRSTRCCERCDAALLIGDPALYLDHEALGLSKIDLGEQWTALTGLPFVWAFWAGRPGVLSRRGARRARARRATPAWRRPTRSPTRTAGPSGRRSAGPT